MKISEKKIEIFDINYDYDEDDEEYDNGNINLPATLTILVPTKLTGNALIETLSDHISEVTGYCHNGFNWKVG